MVPKAHDFESSVVISKGKKPGPLTFESEDLLEGIHKSGIGTDRASHHITRIGHIDDDNLRGLPNHFSDDDALVGLHSHTPEVDARWIYPHIWQLKSHVGSD